MSATILEMKNVTMIYPGVVALDDVSISFESGSVHALVGENGAGKSTFIKSLAGAITPTSGQIVFDGETIDHANPHRSLELGISTVYQEFSLVPYLSVAENIFLGRWPRKGGRIDYGAMHADAAQLLSGLGVEVPTRARVSELSVGYQQLVEIARAVSREVRVLVMDEPSAPLTEREMSHLYRIVREMRGRGVAVIYISHRMEEIFEICDQVSVLRDGKLIGTMPVASTNEDDLIRMMVDRPLDRVYPERPAAQTAGDPMLEVRSLSTVKLSDISFAAAGGEIVGIAGLVGSGRTEIARAVFGADHLEAGEIFIDGEKREIRSPQDAVDLGIALIPEDRKGQGLLMNMTVSENTVLAAMDKVTTYGILSGRKERNSAQTYVDAMRVRTPSLDAPVAGLSGGNQQKVVLAKWLLTDSRIVFLDEPTRGIDVGAKQEIYELMRELADSGKCVVMISSELPELLGMSDRLIVMYEGRMAATLTREEATPELVLTYSSGLSPKNPINDSE